MRTNTFSGASACSYAQTARDGLSSPRARSNSVWSTGLLHTLAPHATIRGTARAAHLPQTRGPKLAHHAETGTPLGRIQDKGRARFDACIDRRGVNRGIGQGGGSQTTRRPKTKLMRLHKEFRRDSSARPNCVSLHLLSCAATRTYE